jgi:hypothetical protein
MPAIFTVDQAATFRQVFFMSCDPKMGFGELRDVQETNSEGVPKWVVQVVATFEQFGRAENEILKVGMVGHVDPTKHLGGMPQPVQLAGFRVGVSKVEERTNPKTGEKRVVGGQAWYQADEIRSLMPTASASKKSEV